MNDVAGCRAVVPNQDIADRIVEELQLSAELELLPRLWDYVSAPKPDGYRAKHLVAVVDGLRVEIQVRTEPQQRWCDLVERLDFELSLGAKFGRADPDVAAALTNASVTTAAFEHDEIDEADWTAALASVEALIRARR